MSSGQAHSSGQKLVFGNWSKLWQFQPLSSQWVGQGTSLGTAETTAHHLLCNLIERALSYVSRNRSGLTQVRGTAWPWLVRTELCEGRLHCFLSRRWLWRKAPRKNSFQSGRGFLSTCLDLESVIICIYYHKTNIRKVLPGFTELLKAIPKKNCVSEKYHHKKRNATAVHLHRSSVRKRPIPVFIAKLLFVGESVWCVCLGILLPCMFIYEMEKRQQFM